MTEGGANQKRVQPSRAKSMMVDGEKQPNEVHNMTLDSARGRTLESARGAESLDGSMINESIKYQNEDGDAYGIGDDGHESDGSNSEEGKYNKLCQTTKFVVASTMVLIVSEYCYSLFW